MDSTPTPATSLLILNVELRPALRLAMTMPFTIETRLLFSGTSCFKPTKLKETKPVRIQSGYLSTSFNSSYHFKLNNVTGPYLRYLSTSSHFLHSLLVYNLKKVVTSVNVKWLIYPWPIVKDWIVPAWYAWRFYQAAWTWFSEAHQQLTQGILEEQTEQNLQR